MKPNNKSKEITVSGNWFYMHPEDKSARSIYEAISAEKSFETDLWDELEILEITLSNQGTIDFQRVEPELGDDIGEAFLKKHDIHSLYTVSFQPEHADSVFAVFEKIVSVAGGFFCEDTETLNNIFPKGN